jgi:hypothetical protein
LVRFVLADDGEREPIDLTSALQLANLPADQFRATRKVKASNQRIDSGYAVP